MWQTVLALALLTAYSGLSDEDRTAAWQAFYQCMSLLLTPEQLAEMKNKNAPPAKAAGHPGR